MKINFKESFYSISFDLLYSAIREDGYKIKLITGIDCYSSYVEGTLMLDFYVNVIDYGNDFYVHCGRYAFNVSEYSAEVVKTLSMEVLNDSERFSEMMITYHKTACKAGALRNRDWYDLRTFVTGKLTGESCVEEIGDYFQCENTKFTFSHQGIPYDCIASVVVDCIKNYTDQPNCPVFEFSPSDSAVEIIYTIPGSEHLVYIEQIKIDLKDYNQDKLQSMVTSLYKNKKDREKSIGKYKAKLSQLEN